MTALAESAELPAGVELPDGRVLTYRPHRDCGCRDCVDAYRAWRDGRLTIRTREPLPW